MTPIDPMQSTRASVRMADLYRYTSFLSVMIKVEC
jgi:hypothetical protein